MRAPPQEMCIGTGVWRWLCWCTPCKLWQVMYLEKLYHRS
jgi:hypothetical protein